ncbi:MAG: hypothetical protein AAF602_11550 [Myxococcota bacterium]
MAIEMMWMAGRPRVLDPVMALELSGATVTVRGGSSWIERSPAGDRGVLALPDQTWVLLGDLHATTREMRTPAGRTVTLQGLLGRFASPPGGAVVREVVAMLLVGDDDPILDAMAAFDGSLRPAVLTHWPTPPPRPTPFLLPRLVRGTPPIVARALDEAGDETTAELAAHPIGEDLSLVYVDDGPESLRRLTMAEATAIEPDVDRRLGRAVANLASLPLVRIVGDGPIFAVRRSGEHEATFLLLPALWETLDPLLDGPRLVAMPRHDVLLVTGDTGPERRARLRVRAQEALRDGSNAPRLSRSLHAYDPSAGIWRLVDDPA